MSDVLRRRQAAVSWLLSVTRDPILRSNLRAELAEVERTATASNGAQDHRAAEAVRDTP